MANRTFTGAASLRRIEMIRQFMVGGPKTRMEISAGAFMALHWTATFLDHMVEKKLIHVSAWVEHEYRPGYVRKTELYTWGSGRNKPKPRPMTKMEGWRKYRAKMTDEQRDIERARGRAKSLVPRRDPMHAFLFVEART
jgi:hypothetical protein